MDGVEVVSLLEGGWASWREACEALSALWGAVREPWLARSVLGYWARTGSSRALELLARAPEPHARHLLDALGEQLRSGEGPARRSALAALAPLVARRPAWLPRLPHHPLPRDLVRAARTEREPLPLLHALLALAALVPAAPALAPLHWPDLLEVLLRPAALHPAPTPAVRAHLHLAQLALFHALYATHPVTLIETLRAELTGCATGAVREAWERELQPLIQSVRLHPALVTGSRASEAEAARRLEEHEIVAETRRLTLYTPEPPPAPASPPPGPPPLLHASLHPPVGRVAALRPGTEPWFALSERCGADSAPHTPLPAEADPGEPPEAAVEATPENTPAKEPRASFRFPSSESGAVRALGRRAFSARASSPPRSPPPSESGGGGAGRLARVMAERRALDSPVLFPPAGGGVPPAGALRVHPHRPTDIDQEVVQLTSGATPLPAPWENSPPVAPPRDPRRLAARPPRSVRRPAAGAAAPARRPASAGPRGVRTASVAVQTVDTWPEPYEFLIADFYRTIHDHTHNPDGRSPLQPCERLDAYLEELYRGGGGSHRPSPPELAEQLALTHAQLMYERWRREAHAERNRRLLGRCRQARAHDLHAQALRDRLRAVTAECEELRARLAARGAGDAGAGGAGSAGGAGAQAGEEMARLEAALQAERAARARAEARLQEAECGRAAAVREVQASRGEAFEAARHVEALARAALAAERRAEHVRRLRQELLVLAERDHRLTEAARVPPAPPAAAPPLERALRAACARAEAEALSAAGRADAAAARAHELEAALASRDTVLTELKRAARLSAEENAAKLQALQQRYDTLLRVLRAAEGRKLEALGAAPLGARAHPPPPADGDDADLPDGS